MNNERTRLQRLEYDLVNTRKLLNPAEKNSKAYQKILKDIQGLTGAISVAKITLANKISKIQRDIDKAKVLEDKARTEREKQKCANLIGRLENELKQLK